MSESHEPHSFLNNEIFLTFQYKTFQFYYKKYLSLALKLYRSVGKQSVTKKIYNKCEGQQFGFIKRNKKSVLNNFRKCSFYVLSVGRNI